MSTETIKEINQLLKHNSSSNYVILNLKQSYGKLDNLQSASDYIVKEYPNINFILVSSTYQQLSVLCNMENIQDWYNYLKTNIDNFDSYKININDNIFSFVLFNAIVDDSLQNNKYQYPEKLGDDIISKSFSFFRKKSLIPEPEEEEYYDPESYGLGAW